MRYHIKWRSLASKPWLVNLVGVPSPKDARSVFYFFLIKQFAEPPRIAFGWNAGTTEGCTRIFEQRQQSQAASNSTATAVIIVGRGCTFLPLSVKPSARYPPLLFNVAVRKLVLCLCSLVAPLIRGQNKKVGCRGSNCTPLFTGTFEKDTLRQHDHNTNMLHSIQRPKRFVPCRNSLATDQAPWYTARARLVYKLDFSVRQLCA